MTVGHGHVWVEEAVGKNTQLEAVDPNGYTHSGRYSIPGPSSCVPRLAYYTCAPVIGRSAVWVPVASGLVPVDYHGVVGTEVRVSGGVIDVSKSGGQIWALTRSGIDQLPLKTPGGHASPYYTFPDGVSPQHIVASGSAQWVSTVDSEGRSYLDKISDGRLLREINVPGLQRMGVAAGRLWVGGASSLTCNAANSITERNLETGAVMAPPLRVDSTPVWIAPAGSGAWISTYNVCNQMRQLVLIARS